MSLKNIISLSVLSVLLSGCGTIPASGPYSQNIKQSDNVSIKLDTYNDGGKPFRYAVAEIDNGVLGFLKKQTKKVSSQFVWPNNEEAEEITVAVGDTITVSIFESQSGGLFIPGDSSVRPGNFITLPSQTIGSDGKISVPYAGEIIAAGQTTDQISQLIEDRLVNKAIEPQIVVSFNDRSGAEVSVIGNVNDARRLPLGFNKYKILDVIASAGGPASPGYENNISLQRGDKEYTIPFEQLVVNPERNIYAQVNDTIYLYNEPQTFTAYGAVSNQGNIPFGKRDVNLSEALGLTGGLRDTQADPAEIYIYRQRKYDYFTDAPAVKTDNVETASIKKSSNKFFNALLSPQNKKIDSFDAQRIPAFKTNSKVFTDGKKRSASVNKPQKKIIEPIKQVNNKETAPSLIEDGEVSVIFKLDMRKPSSFFLAQNFLMEDQDIIYVANAESVEFLKFLNIISSSSGTTSTTKNAF